MSPSTLSPEDHAIKLVFEPRTYVAGERVAGFVELDLYQAQEDKVEQVDIKLRGVATACVQCRHPACSFVG
jgi:hypothetical protein